ncbi:MAG: 4-diphosphocytidyl-2C-methyl-D-erythritol kinase, partial [Rhizomicrobium sp.]
MWFGRLPVAQAAGAILAHGVRQAGLSFRKGRVLSLADVAQLQEAGIFELTAARLERGDVAEDEAAARIARAAAGHGVRVGAAFTGRANLYAESAGVLVIDAERIGAANRLDEAVTLASLPSFAKVAAGQMLATIKIIPFAAPETTICRIESCLAQGPVTRVAPFRPQRAALISTVLPGMKQALLAKTRQALDTRLNPLGSSVAFERRVAHGIEAVAEAIREAVDAGADAIFLMGASAIADRRDVLPAALLEAGGLVTALGMPVDPGNLLMMGRLGDHVVVGLPGCARSPKLNGFDFVLWRVLAGLEAGRKEIAAMGVGGLLADTAERLHPREMKASSPHLPRIGAIVLAAGQSSRMGRTGRARNKLL